MRKVGSEAPALRLLDAQNSEQIVGMIHEQIQLLLFRPNQALLKECRSALGPNTKVRIVAIEAQGALEGVTVLADPQGLFARRYGIDQGGVVVDKEGIICAITDRLDAADLLIEAALSAAKPKRGHDHENWMRA